MLPSIRELANYDIFGGLGRSIQHEQCVSRPQAAPMAAALLEQLPRMGATAGVGYQMLASMAGSDAGRAAVRRGATLFCAKATGAPFDGDLQPSVVQASLGNNAVLML